MGEGSSHSHGNGDAHASGAPVMKGLDISGMDMPGQGAASAPSPAAT
ncbi:MAG: hypothetical protein KGK04_11630 [Xanthomonadaceae bacterium]|nr:hypothetical protein [Xanthomonadaceae bacterium]